MESTYGDRVHNDMNQSEEELLRAVIDTCCKKKGKLLIPSFAVGRAQEIIFALNKLWETGMLPKIDVYVDSPLSLNATNIMRLHSECFCDEMKEFMKTDPDPFGFEKLHYIQSTAESKELNYTKIPCIIISASGMMEAGRIKHHIANNIENVWQQQVAFAMVFTIRCNITNVEAAVCLYCRKFFTISYKSVIDKH